MADAYIGEIRLFAGSFCPLDWMYCEGQSISVASNTALYSILGNTYGGTPNKNFNLPDLRGKVPMGFGSGSGLTPRTLGAQAGSASVSLTTNNMPAHAHTVQGKKTPGTTIINDPAGHTWTSGGANKIYASAPNAQMNTNCVIPVTGTAAAHKNIQPCVGIHYIICVAGYYPTPE